MSRHHFASMFDYEIWGDRVRALDMPYLPLQPHGILDEIRIVWRILQAVPRERALLLRSQIGFFHPDVVACVLMGFIPRRLRPKIAMGGDMWLPNPGLRGALEKLAIRLADRAVDRYFVFSTDELTVFPRLWRIDPAKVRVCVYKYTFTDEELSGDRTVEPGLVFAGGSGGRDWRPLIEAAARFPQCRFVFATRDVDRSAAVPPNVEVGPVPHAEFVRLMRAAEAVIVPIARDLPRAVGQQTYLNAMYLGKPTIVADGLGVRDHIRDRADALIVDGTAAGYTQALGWLLDPANAAAVDKLSEAAHRRAAEFSPERLSMCMYAQMLELLASLGEREPSPAHAS